jgi:hypothetical protein
VLAMLPLLEGERCWSKARRTMDELCCLRCYGWIAWISLMGPVRCSDASLLRVLNPKFDLRSQARNRKRRRQLKTATTDGKIQYNKRKKERNKKMSVWCVWTIKKRVKCSKPNGNGVSRYRELSSVSVSMGDERSDSLSGAWFEQAKMQRSLPWLLRYVGSERQKKQRKNS